MHRDIFLGKFQTGFVVAGGGVISKVISDFENNFVIMKNER
jgi:hypothetical protein